MIAHDLYKRSMWLNKNIDYLFRTPITEYDMKSAGLSIVEEFGLLDSVSITELKAMEKEARNKKIGLIQRDNPDFKKALSEGFIEARKRFFEGNDIQEEEIVSIKKDAFFIQGRECENLQFGCLRFDSKNEYTSYLYLNKLEFYLNPKRKKIDIKGLGQKESLERVLELHGGYILDFIMKFTALKENHTDKKLMVMRLTNFIRKYRNKELPIGYYRELAKGNSYRLYIEDLEDFTNVEETEDILNVDIIFNYMAYILPLATLYL